MLNFKKTSILENLVKYLDLCYIWHWWAFGGKNVRKIFSGKVQQTYFMYLLIVWPKCINSTQSTLEACQP